MQGTRQHIWGRIGIYAAITVVLIVLHGIGWLWPIERGISFVLTPIQQRVYGTGVWFSKLYTRSDHPDYDQVMAENVALRAERDRLQVEDAALRALLIDQTTLKTQADFLTAQGLRGVAARVIGKTVDPTVDIIEINRGSQDGVVVGAPVIVGPGVLAGKIIQVRSNSAEVLLITDERSRVAGSLVDTLQTIGIISGERGLGIRMDLIPQAVALQVGQVIVTTGLELGIPKGMVIGRIDRIETSPTASFQTAHLASPVDLHTVTVVSIILPNHAQ
jgi:rod shape-determining protein MreC